MVTYLKNNMTIILATLALSIIAFAIVNSQPVYAEDGDIDGGVFDGVPWRITSDYELIIGEAGKEYTFDKEDRISYPWDSFSDVLKTAKIEGTVHGNGEMIAMFRNCSSLTSLDLSGFDTSNVTDIHSMFSDCSSLTSLDLSDFDTSNVRDMNCMLSGCSSLTSLDLSGFDTSKVYNMYGMFYDCSSLTSLSLSGFNTSNVVSMSIMFSNCSSLTNLDLSGFNTGNVTNMSSMFSDCSSLTSLDLSGFNTGNVTEMTSMFSNCSSLTSLDLSGFDTGKVEKMTSMFSHCSALTSLDVSNFDTRNVTIMKNMFSNCSSLTSLDVSNFDTSNVTFLYQMFFQCESLTSLDLSSFDASSATHMMSMFSDCSSLTSLKIGKGFNTNVYDTSNRATFPVTMYDSSDGTEYLAGSTIPSDDYKIYVSDLSIDPGNYEDPDTSEVHEDFKTAYQDKEREFTGEKGYYYKDSYFYNASTAYNHSLATMSLCMAISTYGYGDYDTYDKNVKKLMRECGFTKKDMYEQYHFNEKPSEDSIACVIGCKEISIDGLDVPVIAVAVRSSGYEAEWASNLKVGKDGDHSGFDQSAELVKNYVIDYISKKKITGNIKIWITGYSRGGAVATQTAAKLDDLGGFAYQDEDSNTGYSQVDFDKTSIYAYGFATPAGVVSSSNPHSSKYSNIYNIIEYNDPVPLVAPEKWKFERYGKTKMFPYRESSNNDCYQQYINNIELRLDDGNGYNISNFKNYNIINDIDYKNHDTQGTALRKAVRAIADAIGGRDLYYSIHQYSLQKNIAKKYKENQTKGDKYIVAYLLGEAIIILPQLEILHPNLCVTITENLNTLAEVHADNDYYLGWMQLMDNNYLNDLPLVWGNPNYRIVKANCPVDLFVYDSNNDIVASIVDEEPYDEENGIIVSIDENGQKIAYLPVDSDYTVQVKAREGCDVSYGVEEYDAEFGEPTRVTNFEPVHLLTNECVTAEVESFAEDEIEAGAPEGSEVEYTLIKGNDTIDITGDYHGEENINAHTYNVTVSFDDTLGTVVGGGSFTEGSYASIEAISNEDSIFSGFYINGEQYVDDTSEDSHKIRIKVTGDIEIEAAFTKVAHVHTWKHFTNPAGYLKNGLEYDECEVCHERQNVTALPGYANYYVKSFKVKKGKKSFTAKWKKQSKKNQKKFNGYQIRYATKSDMSDAKYATAGKKSKSKKIKKLKKKTKYFVQVRTYTTTGNGTFYSKWSPKKSLKTK